MKWMRLRIILPVLLFGQLIMFSQNENLTEKEVEQIKKEIIQRAEKQATDLQNLDYEQIMTFYADVDDFIVYGDGYYWGDYITIDRLWKSFTKNVKENTWTFSNPKIHVFNKDVASLLVEFDHHRTHPNGAKRGGHGCFSFGLQKIESDWKVVTMHVTHNYDVFDENGEIRKWWINLMPENREKN
ncbi:LptF/LptG family permease [Gramella jeungdoensis]|uniref:LptF/LptG family permease n=1 Tax=Gramella jeungdoensis TaxID=708091 RepID=A0ABT0YZI8_9FLAO|nr:nuclear transport factor 2 family protein [Gramella jeungdoensis]MCM8568555.1 LptF/LptG family permease [Gramella jeungdoensis]